MYPPGLRLHGKNYRIQKRVPQDCLSHYQGKVLLYLNTGKSNKSEAASIAWKWLAEMDAEFVRIRRAHPVKTSITLEEMDWVISQIVHAVLSFDERERYCGRSVGLPEHLQQELDSGLKACISSGDFRAVALQADYWLRQYDYDLATGSENLRRFSYKLAVALHGTQESIAKRSSGIPVETPKPATAPASLDLSSSTSPMLSKVLERFLSKQDKNAPMYTKYSASLALFIEILGDVPTGDIRQTDIEDFFTLLCKLPPRWKDVCRIQNKTPKQVAEANDGPTIALKTFEDTYVAAIRPFLSVSATSFGDQGFPRHLTTDNIKYSGNQKKSINKQRAFRLSELKSLFESPLYADLAVNPKHAAKYWLPLIGLYTGARVNEICQLNPSLDVLEHEGIPYFVFTAETETDLSVRKSIKTKQTRTLPIHPELIRLGFMSYIEQVRKQGSKIIFPTFKPVNGRASPQAEKWFVRFLRELYLRDETPGKRLVGMHAFRSTMVTRCMDLEILEVGNITGHSGSASVVLRGYDDGRSVKYLFEKLRQITFDVNPPV